MEPTNNAHQFFIQAASAEKGGEEGFLIHIDFKEFHTRHCTGFDTPGAPGSDYEKFIPHTYKSDHCNNSC